MIRVYPLDLKEAYYPLTRVNTAKKTILHNELSIPQSDIKKAGVRHSIVKVFYGKHITAFQKASEKNDVGKGAAILAKIPSILTDVFCELSDVIR